MILHRDQQARSFQIGKHSFPRLIAFQTVIRRTRQLDARLLVHDVQLRQVMSLPDRKVIWIVRRRHLHCTGSKLRIRPFIGDDRDLTVWLSSRGAQRQNEHLADHAGIARIRRVHRNRHIAEHRLRPCRCDGDGTGAVRKRVAHFVELPRAFLMYDLKIAHCRLQVRIPVHDVGAAIDEPLLPESHKRLAHSETQPFVHGEVLAGPVNARTQPPHLLGDRPAVLLFPAPHTIGECLAPKLLPRRSALRVELPLHHHLCGDTRVIGARYPHAFFAQHAVPAREDVHLRLVQHVSHVQAPRDIWRRQELHKRLRGGDASLV